MKFSVGLSTNPGPRAGVNQDSASIAIPAANPHSALVVVADGMGGANAGDYASQQAVAIVKEVMLDGGLPPESEIPERLKEAIGLANSRIYKRSTLSPEMQGMGCTIVVAAIVEDRYWIASVGDSRAYLMRDKKIKQLTEDHTWVNAQVRVGLLTPEQAANHDLQHVLERAVGTDADVDIDVLPANELETGDVLILCSDGLYNVVADERLPVLVYGADAQEAADTLVQAALDAPARDNITVGVLKVLK